MKKFQFTQEGYIKLKKEMEGLVSIKRPHAVERLQQARAMGDLSENSEYSAAKEDLAFVEGRIKELEELLKNAEIVEQYWDGEIVEIGNRVVVQVDGRNDEFLIVGEFEANPLQKKLSSTSPIGKALLGKKVGERVEVKVPVGKIIYKILDIKKA